MKTGDIYQVNLDPALGDEIKKTRPVVILNPGHQKIVYLQKFLQRILVSFQKEAVIMRGEQRGAGSGVIVGSPNVDDYVANTGLTESRQQ